MARIDKKTGEKVYMTEDRQYVVKDQLLNVMFDTIRGFKDIIVTADKSDPYGDPRFDALTLFMTTFTLDEDESNELIAVRRQMLKERINPDMMAPKDQNRVTFEVNIEIIAKCQSCFDRYYGIKKKQEIMRVASPSIEKAKEKYGGDHALGLMFAGKSNETAEMSD